MSNPGHFAGARSTAFAEERKSVAHSDEGYAELPGGHVFVNLEDEVQLLHKLKGTMQNPPAGAFTYEDLHWLPHISTGNGFKKECQIAVISWDRLEDFVVGEQSNENFPCKFTRTKDYSRSMKPNTLREPRANSSSLVIRFCCNFGPEDKSMVCEEDIEKLLLSTQKKRKQKAAKGKGKKPVEQSTESQSAGPKKTRVSKTASGMSIKRGCQRRFIAKQPYLDNSLCLLIYENLEHRNKQGRICHGTSILGFRHTLGARLSESKKEEISIMLRFGLSPAMVMAKHKESVRERAARGDPITRDSFVLPSDVANLASIHDEETWKKHKKESISVELWVAENPLIAFYYQKHTLCDLNQAIQDDTPFTLGLQNEWQQNMMARFGHKSAFAFDATFGTNKTRYPLYTMMVFDEWQNGIPVAFIIMGRSREGDLKLVLQALAQRMEPAWMPNAIIVDNAQAEINVLSEIWPLARVFLCLWHVRKSWAENAVKKIRDAGTRAQVLNSLGKIMYSHGLGITEDPVHWAEQKIKDLGADFPLEERFTKYLNKHWAKKAAMWCIGNRNIPHAGQNTNSAIESYHGNMKSILCTSRETIRGRRMDWLIHQLLNDVLDHYWYGVQCKLYGTRRNKKMEGILASAVLRAHEIPDENVVLFPDGDNVALVASINNRPHVWTIHAPDSEWAQCDCPIATQGIVCKHLMKVGRMLNPGLRDGDIIRQGGTFFGVERSFVSAEHSPPEMGFPDCEVLPNRHTSTVTQTSTDCPEHISAIQEEIEYLFQETMKNACQNPFLALHLHADLRALKGKQLDLLARTTVLSGQRAKTTLLPALEGDNSLKRMKGMLER